MQEKGIKYYLIYLKKNNKIYIKIIYKKNIFIVNLWNVRWIFNNDLKIIINYIKKKKKKKKKNKKKKIKRKHII